MLPILPLARAVAMASSKRLQAVGRGCRGGRKGLGEGQGVEERSGGRTGERRGAGDEKKTLYYHIFFSR